VDHLDGVRDRLRVEAAAVDMDMNPAGGIGLRARRAYRGLKVLDILVAEDRRRAISDVPSTALVLSWDGHDAKRSLEAPSQAFTT
jgi:hypothetical protein